MGIYFDMSVVMEIYVFRILNVKASSFDGAFLLNIRLATAKLQGL